MELYVVFPNDPPEEWLSLQGVKVVSAKELGSIEGKFVVVVGDCQLAERLKVACLTEEEAEELLKELKVYPPTAQ
ncbi:hypothetical protein Pogu_0626 [Pyrobaculum oguniense TE7]|uniref:Uncharacterized protein n=1 Tax=Pyrobaculum oguniense (strain DSM 13380 / JCM 10595 / TE7) TaxID=698757 RepID=H6Q7Z6_PYROT|nr:hypothetical protein Pogu_0626 [Pyrobaculum oguniense TE7]